jgi:hypothetical protein
MLRVTPPFVSLTLPWCWWTLWWLVQYVDGMNRLVPTGDEPQCANHRLSGRVYAVLVYALARSTPPEPAATYAPPTYPRALSSCVQPLR